MIRHLLTSLSLSKYYCVVKYIDINIMQDAIGRMVRLVLFKMGYLLLFSPLCTFSLFN